MIRAWEFGIALHSIARIAPFLLSTLPENGNVLVISAEQTASARYPESKKSQLSIMLEKPAISPSFHPTK